MDTTVLKEERYYSVLGRSSARMEMPGCSLCMGNQGRMRTGATAVSAYTRNFPNRMGQNTRAYLGKRGNNRPPLLTAMTSASYRLHG